MSIKTNLNIAPYFDDYDISKKYYRVLFKPGFAVQARELTQLQTTLQNQIEQFGENIYKEGSIIKGCTFTELRNLQYVKVVDGIRPEDYIERTVVNENTDVIDEYYYEIEDVNGLKAFIVQAQSGFQSRAPDLNTFFVLYLNTVSVGGFEKKEYEPNDTLSIREYILRSQRVDDEVVETTIDNGIVRTTSVASFSNPIGQSFGLNASEGVIFQRGHFLFVDDQTIVIKKYMSDVSVEFEAEPNNISVGYSVDETIVNSQQDISLRDNANGSPNENAPGADRLLLVPKLVSRVTVEAEADSEFFILRRYENGEAVQTRDVAQFNSIATEMARRTYEAHGDFTKNPFTFRLLKSSSTEDDDFVIEMSEGVAYSKGYRMSNDAKRIFRVPAIETTTVAQSQPLNFTDGGFCVVVANTGRITIGSMQTVDLLNTTSTKIGTAVVKNYTKDRLYLMAIRMLAGNNFDAVRYVKEGTTNGEIEIQPKIINSTESTLVHPINQSFIKTLDDLSFIARESRTSVPTNGSGVLTLEPNAGTILDANTLRELLVIRPDNSAAVISNASLSIDGNLILTTDAIAENVTVFYNARLQDAQPRLKQISEIYVKTTYDTDQPTYTLGLPDVISILEIKVQDDTSETDYKDSFKLVKNQKDNFYDHSYIERIVGRNLPADNAILIIKLKVFRIDSSSDLNFFVADSYINAASEDIPMFESASGKIFDLRNSIDFRPYRINTASYSTTAAGATLLAGADIGLPGANTQLFDSSINYAIPAFDTSGIADIEFYNKRIDYIVGTSYGRFAYIVGDEKAAPSNKFDSVENMIIAEVLVPGFPLLEKDIAFKIGKRNETVKITPKITKTYTMKDIDNISKRIDKLVYYTVLSALEASTKNLLITDENGLNRFKNGIIVDPFNDLSIADIGDPVFKASVDPSEKALYPAFKQIPMNLKVNSFAGTQAYDTSNKIVSLTSNRLVPFITQQYATSFRNCVSDFYKYNGTGALTPEYDFAYDTVNTPANIDIDLATPFAEFTEALSEFVPLTNVLISSDILSTNSTTDAIFDGGGTTITTTTTSSIEDTLRSLEQSSTSNTNKVGDFVTSFELSPFIRSREIQIELYGLRPNTRHFFFFDKQDINEFVAPGSFFADLQGSSTELRVQQSGAYGASVNTNANGELFAVFKIPENRFLVGERELIVVDVPTIEDAASSSISSGSLKYNAFNFSVDKIGLTVSTRMPQYSVSEARTTRTITTRTTQFIPLPPQDNGGGGESMDPLAQTFFVKEAHSLGSDAVFVGSIDVFFKRKSAVNGVTIQLREVMNGYPTNEVLPFAQKFLRPAEVNVSDDSSLATSVFFDAPIRLDAEKEYAVVVLPAANDPDYLIYTTKVGGTDLITGRSINSDWGDGVLFTSTNNRAWKSYQDEDIKFVLYRHNFNTNTGTVELETDNQEFLTLESTIGRFITDELVYAFKGANTFSVNLTSGSNIITGSGLVNYDVGDYFYVETPTEEKDVLKILSINPAGTEAVIARPPLVSGNSLQSQPVVVGKVNYFNTREPTFIALEQSSARLNRIFESSDIIRGIESGARSTIVSIDNVELSYLQSMISRVTDSDTDISIRVKAIDPANPTGAAYLENFDFSEKKTFSLKGAIIFSKSNDLEGAKNLRVVLELKRSSNSQTMTPLVDVETSKLFTYFYKITNDSATSSRYISKKVELQEGFDSEDFRLYLTGYRPAGSQIKVYIRAKNAADPVSLRNNPWIELNITQGENMFSSISNENDYREFVYELPDSAKNDGILTYTNETGTYETYRSFAIRIDLLSDNIAIAPKVLDYRGIAFE
jgi:hypothetical protein